MSSRTLFTPTGAAAGDLFGTSVSSAGDVNGDGFADLIVGAPFNDAAGLDAGRAYVYFGGPAGDATADLTLTGAAVGDQFGTSVSSAGDFNGDGFADLIVGAYRNDAAGADAGRAYVYLGGPSADATADYILTGVAAGDFFGLSVASAGDVNGDGFGDVIVGAVMNDAGGANAGRAYVYYGGLAADAAADLTLTGAATGDWFGYAVASAGDVNGDGFGDLIVSAMFNDAAGVDAGRAYVFLGGPSADDTADLTLTGAAALDRFGYSVSGAGDVNGDGYSDLLVGAYGNDAGGTDAGRAYLYFGGPSADATADLVLTGAAAFDNFGDSASSSDLNGDGFSDLIVGASENDAGGSNAGRVYVFLGGPAVDTVADLVLTGAAAGDGLGLWSAAAGDVDGDGYPDLIGGAWGSDAGGTDAGRAYVVAIYPYQVISPNGGEQWIAGRSATVRWRGHDVADLAISFDGGVSWSALVSGVGGQDQNEFAVVAPTITTSGARVRVSYSGQSVSRATSDLSDGVFRIVDAAAPPSATVVAQMAVLGAAAFDYFGYSVGGGGDINGDGFSDLIVGAPLADAGFGDEGKVYIYQGGAAADANADLVLSGATFSDFFGWAVASAGDVNGDGYADVIVGAPFNDAGGADAGRAYVFHGGPSADAVADLTLTGDGFGDLFGSAVAGAGDVNGDGFADVIVGAFSNDAGGAEAGRAYVFHGGPSADATPDLTLTGVAAGDAFGAAVASAGDVNGDGFADVIVGAYGNDAGGTDAGRAYVYLGGAAADAAPDLTLTGAAANDQFGVSVAGAGDINGDGFSDLIVGAHFSDAAGSDAGRAYVYLGGPSADAIADLTLTGAAAADEFGGQVAGAGDVNADGFADVIVGARQNDSGGTSAGRAYVYLGGPVADADADFTMDGPTGDQFGSALAGAGDFNGDGFADVISGTYLSSALFFNSGRFYLYDFNRYFVISPNDDELWNVGAARTVSWMGAERADVWLSTDGGASYELLRHDVGGHELNSISLLVPHTPTTFARVKVTPVDEDLRGFDESDSTFTIQSSVALLSFVARPGPDGIELSWSSEPAVGPAGLAGYRLYRIGPGDRGNGTRLGPGLIADSRYTDSGGAAGSAYRLTAVNGLMEELELGRVSLAPAAPLAAWPLPYRGGELQVSFGVNGLFGSQLGQATVELFDLAGRKVKSIAGGSFRVGHQLVTWDGRDDDGAPLRTGMYFLRATSGGASHQLKLIVAR